jgi:hypothetical protein
MAGVRPISLLGAEVDYMDFGHPGGSLNGAPASATLKGAAAFGLLYLPVPVIDIYAKAGLARLQSSLGGVSAVQPACVPCALSLFRLDRTNTHFAAGAGAQYKLGAFALRAEYEFQCRRRQSRSRLAGDHLDVLLTTSEMSEFSSSGCRLYLGQVAVYSTAVGQKAKFGVK